MRLIYEVQVFSDIITNCNHLVTSCGGPILCTQDRQSEGEAEVTEDHTSCHPRWSHINAATSGCGAKQDFQRQNETEMDGLDVYRQQGADKRWQPEEAWEDIPAEMVKKSFLKTGISNSMDGTEDDHLWQDSGESSSEDEEPEETWDTDERLTQQELEDLFGESDDEDFGFV